MYSPRLSLGLILACGAGLFSVGCLSKKSEPVTEAAPPPPAEYPGSPATYGGGTNPVPGADRGYAVTATPPAPSQPVPFELRDGEQLITHMIESGDSLSSISGKYNTSISRIMSANGMTDTMIYAGKPIQVPAMVSASVAMGSGAAARTPSYGAPAPPQQNHYGAPPAPRPTGSAAGYQPQVYPSTTADPSSTSYQRQPAPSAPGSSFPTPRF